MSTVPVVLLVAFALPEPLRRTLAFDYAEPTILTAYTATFVHLNLGHLLVNVVGYCVIISTAYVLSVLSGCRHRFYVVFGTFLLAFPLALSYLNLAILRPTVSVGFSGILLAFLGYLPLVMAEYLAEYFDLGPRRLLSPALFFGGLTLIVVLSLRSVLFSDPTVLLGTSLLVVATLLSAVLFAVAAVDSPVGSWPGLSAALARTGYFEFGLVAGVVFLGFPFVAFPPDPTAPGGIINFYVHVLGYALGFMVTYSSVEIGARLPGPEFSI